MPYGDDTPAKAAPDTACTPAAPLKSCPPQPREEAECPKCASQMRLWANYYRCPNCGYKESCCF